MAGRSTFEDHGDHIVQRTPGEPDFWFGNCLCLRDAMANLEEWERVFAGYFPDASHRTFTFDHPESAGWALPPLPEDWKTEVTEFMVLEGDIRRAAHPAGFSLRPITSDLDWEQVLQLQLLTGIEEGHPAPEHEAYLRTKFRELRAAAGRGRLCWFGAFEGSQLAADMGICVGDGLARYQSVETAPSYRRRGLCAALLVVAHDWAKARDREAQIVIAADAKADAGRIYARAGFVTRERILSLFKPGY